ncbi:MAG: hypothetical protein AB7O24_08605 [Kofleriaceae bacterium]
MADTDLPPAGLTWGEYVERWVADCGGWVPLADRLIHRAGDSFEIAQDPQTVERGLRRLARRHHKPGGQYGRWMLRLLGFTAPIEQFVKWMGIYHTRFADLPSGLRLQHLALWNRPPVTESSLACWIELGIASAHYSRLDLTACEHWLARAERRGAAAGIEALLELGLVRAQLDSELGRHDAARERHAIVGAQLADAALPNNFAASYRARLHHQRASLLTTPPDGGAPNIDGARALYEAIPESQVPFVRFRKLVGLAYCAWKSGRLDEAIALATEAGEAAGDGGLVRMRVMALNMLSRLVTGERAAKVRARARGMAAALEDEDLMRRVAATTS